jgi:hypothetical protein
MVRPGALVVARTGQPCSVESLETRKPASSREVSRAMTNFAEQTITINPLDPVGGCGLAEQVVELDTECFNRLFAAVMKEHSQRFGSTPAALRAIARDALIEVAGDTCDDSTAYPYRIKAAEILLVDCDRLAEGKDMAPEIARVSDDSDAPDGDGSGEGG